jgi:hypothetical protein
VAAVRFALQPRPGASALLYWAAEYTAQDYGGRGIEVKSHLSISVLAFTATVSAFAFQNEPDGFRGIKWGSDFSQHKNQMTLVEGGKFNLYRREGDKMSIGGAKLESIQYGYEQNRFVVVIIDTEGAANKSALIDAFRSQFGPASKSSHDPEEQQWWGSKTLIHIECQPFLDACRAAMTSMEMLKAERERRRKAAEGAKKDF